MSGPGDRPGGEPAEASGAEGIGDVIRGLLADPRLRRGVSVGKLARSWDRVVGADLAAETAPLTLDAGALLVAASTAGWAARVRFLAEDIRRRATEVLGGEAVRAVNVTVGVRGAKSLGPKGFPDAAGPPGMPGPPPSG